MLPFNNATNHYLTQQYQISQNNNNNTYTSVQNQHNRITIGKLIQDHLLYCSNIIQIIIIISIQIQGQIPQHIFNKKTINGKFLIQLMTIYLQCSTLIIIIN